MVRPDALVELHRISSPRRSWFLDDYVLGHGQILLGTRVDPTFFILFLLHIDPTATSTSPPSSLGPFRSIGDLLCDAPRSFCLLPQLEACMECLCESKSAGGTRFFRASPEKCRSWVLRKFAAFCDSLARPESEWATRDLAALQRHADAPAVSVDDSGLSGDDEERLTPHRRWYALSLFAHYVSPEWTSVVRAHFAIPQKKPAGPAAAAAAAAEAAAKAAAAEKAAAKSKKSKIPERDASTPSIMSFFGKKK